MFDEFIFLISAMFPYALSLVCSTITVVLAREYLRMKVVRINEDLFRPHHQPFFFNQPRMLVCFGQPAESRSYATVYRHHLINATRSSGVSNSLDL
ncbi:hypothetical protein CPB83DRAFT_142011 [Crepidotus variabilis]|uniref:Uncharacterized protein n=1 Tax=Crepidotus variabilis TaxID=179855 RepID=A0A9P6EJG7_9AGAR|nr:hypothetical protein CPB83DRAFT_142011 [Crepidotus variabilis]